MMHGEPVAVKDNDADDWDPIRYSISNKVARVWLCETVDTRPLFVLPGYEATFIPFLQIFLVVHG